jgi:hypothetical protein
MMTAKTAEEYAFRVPATRNEMFKPEGYGPFLVQRAELINDIVRRASPYFSIHIHGCRGSGKTTVLVQVGEQLLSKNKEVYFFDSATDLNRESSISFVRYLVKTKREAYILVDETHSNVNAAAFFILLKNRVGHDVTTIGAGVPEFNTTNARFTHRFGTERLFLGSLDDLERERVIMYFSTNATAADAQEIRTLLVYLRSFVGGHIYPLMWLAERLVSRITSNRESAAQVIDYFGSSVFRQQEDFKRMTERILPNVRATDIHPLLYKVRDENNLYDLRRNGICDGDNRIISQLLFESLLAVLRPATQFPTLLTAGLGGIEQLFIYALPMLSWAQYDFHGGPIEVSLTFEMLIILAGVQHLGTRWSNPKLISDGTAGRKPDIYLNSTIDCYVECVLTTGNNESERKKLDEHISRFYWEECKDPTKHAAPAYYRIGQSGCAILNYQNFGTQLCSLSIHFFRVSSLSDGS